MFLRLDHCFSNVKRVLYNRLEAEIKLIEGEIENIKEYYTGCVVIGYSEKSRLTNKFSSMVEDEVIRNIISLELSI